MSKKLDWNAISMHHGARPLPGAQGKPKYSSGRDYLQKGLEQEAEQRKMQENLVKAMPAMEALLKCRMEDKTPLTVIRPFQYQTSELVHQYEQHWDDSEGGWVNGEVQYSAFQDVAKSIQKGTQLILKGLDHNLSEFIFEDQAGNEVVIPYSAKKGLMLQTNIYEDVVNFINKQEE